jgi:hypothetical protein
MTPLYNGGLNPVNEYELIQNLNELIQKGFLILAKTKKGTYIVHSIRKENELIIIETEGGMKIIEAPKLFLKRHFMIVPKNPEPSPLNDINKIYKELSKYKELIYREEKVIELNVVQNRIVIKTEKGRIMILTLSDMFEYPVLAW